MKFTKEELYQKLGETPIMPLFNHPDIEVNKAIVKACYDGGIKVFEFTNRGENAPQIFEQLVKYIRQELPDLAIGVGTIFNEEEAEYFVSLDTDFIVQPILNPSVGAVCNKYNMAWMPGVMTTSEIYQAQLLGADIIKVFPANVLGTAFIKGVKGPMPKVKLLVTGGVEPKGENLQSWFDSGVFAVGLGSQLFPKSAIESGDYHQIELLVRSSVEYVLKNCLK